MKRENLFEMATMDALGFLEPEERRAFEDAFHSASPALQEELRREQGRLTDLDKSLPVVEPPASLRARVLAAVREAMAAVAPVRASGVLTRIGAPEWSQIHRRVSPLWRAACIGFATATVVLIAVGFNLRQTVYSVEQYINDRDLTEVITRNLGYEFAERLLSPLSQKVSFQPADASMPARAAILIDPETKTAYLVTRDLPAVEGEYRLVVLNDNGELGRSIATFVADGQLSGTPISANIELGTPLAIVPPSVPAEKPKPMLFSL